MGVLARATGAFYRLLGPQAPPKGSHCVDVDLEKFRDNAQDKGEHPRAVFDIRRFKSLPKAKGTAPS